MDIMASSLSVFLGYMGRCKNKKHTHFWLGSQSTFTTWQSFKFCDAAVSTKSYELLQWDAIHTSENAHKHCMGLQMSGHVREDCQDARGRQAEVSLEHKVGECWEDRQPQTRTMKGQRQVHTEASVVGSWKALHQQMKPNGWGISPHLEGEHRVLWYPPMLGGH